MRISDWSSDVCSSDLPTVYVGQFEEQFLQVPPECLILTMRLNQKYFPLFEPASGKLTHRFLIVSNMQVDDPVHIIEGNQRVVRPRLADAQRSEEHTSELQSLMRISYAVFCLKKKKHTNRNKTK